jgi:hypothetical protein
MYFQFSNEQFLFKIACPAKPSGEDGRHAKKITAPLKYRDKTAYNGHSEDYFFQC